MNNKFVILYHVHDGAIVGDGSGNIGFITNEFLASMPMGDWLSDELHVMKPRNLANYPPEMRPPAWEDIPKRVKEETEVQETIVFYEGKVESPAYDYVVHARFLHNRKTWVISPEPPTRIEQDNL